MIASWVPGVYPTYRLSKILTKVNWWLIHVGGFLLGGSLFYFFHPYLGKFSNLTNIFQMG